jgi:hypothetical protein
MNRKRDRQLMASDESDENEWKGRSSCGIIESRSVKDEKFCLVTKKKGFRLIFSIFWRIQ